MKIYIYNKLGFSEKLLIILSAISLFATVVISYIKRPQPVEHCIYSSKFIAEQPYYQIKDECLANFDQIINASNFIHHYGLWFGALICAILLACLFTKIIIWLFNKN